MLREKIRSKSVFIAVILSISLNNHPYCRKIDLDEIAYSFHIDKKSISHALNLIQKRL